MTEEKRLLSVLMAIYERRSGEVRVSPAWLATEAMRELDPERASPDSIYIAAHLEFRQLARSICRTKFEPPDRDGEQHELFPDLQRRYPAARAPTDDPEYVLLEHMTEADVRFNIARLRAEASSKLAHADALEAWWQQRGCLAV